MQGWEKDGLMVLEWLLVVTNQVMHVELFNMDKMA
jgi:hypothetical protein